MQLEKLLLHVPVLNSVITRRRTPDWVLVFVTERTTDAREHGLCVRMECPVVPFPAASLRYSDEALVVVQVLPDVVLPLGVPVPVVVEAAHDVVVDLCQGGHLVGGLLDSHGGQCDVGETGLIIHGLTLMARHGAGT